MKVAEKLLTYGAKVSISNHSGNTALHYAALSGFHEAIMMMLDKDVTVDITNNEGETPLRLAVLHLLGLNFNEIPSLEMCEGLGEIIKVLHSAQGGSSDEKRMRFHESKDPLKQIIELFLDRGANPNSKANDGETVIEYCFTWAKTFSKIQTQEYFDALKKSLN